MALPPAEELSRWTVNQVTNWLTQCSLTTFRDDFLNEGIDGSKLMRLTSSDIDRKYTNVHVKKRTALKEYLNKIASSRPPPVVNWTQSRPPPLPSRDKPTKPPLQPEIDDPVDSDGGWSEDEFEDDDIDQDYVEPTTQPANIRGFKPNGQHPLMAPPEEVYEIPAEEMDNIRETHQVKVGLERKGTILDRLKNELESRKFHKAAPAAQSDDSGSDSDGSSYVEPIGNIEGPPPPRPPRPGAVTRPPDAASPPAPVHAPVAAQTRSRPPPPVPQLVPDQSRSSPGIPDQSRSPPGDVYEIVSDVAAQEKSDDEDYLEPEPPINLDLSQNKHAASSFDVSQTSKKREPVPRAKETAPKPPDEPPRPRKISQEKSPPALPPLPATPGGWLHTNATPAPPQSPSDDLSVFPWYHGKIGREAAQRIFTRERKDGLFLIRKSERDISQPYTLMLWYDRIWNIPIRRLSNGKYAAGKFKEGETQFSTIQELVDHFKTISLNLKSNNQVEGSHRLTEAAPRR